MKNIKTYEGFFDFLKKKKKVNNEPVYIDDIKECLLDLTEDPRVDHSLDGPLHVGVFNTYNDVFNVKSSLSFDSDYEDLANNVLGLPEYIKYNMMAVRIRYNRERDAELLKTKQNDRGTVSDDELKRLLSICESKLKTYNCEVSYYLAWGDYLGKYNPNEFKTIDKLFNAINKDKDHQDVFSPNITIKITAPTKIII